MCCCLIFICGKSEGKMKMKETPERMVTGDVRHLPTQTAENVSDEVVILSRKESCLGNKPFY